MNTGKRIPATLTAILAILALTACGETPKGDGQGTVNNPDAEAHTWAKLRQGFPYSALACLDRLIEHERNQQ